MTPLAPPTEAEVKEWRDEAQAFIDTKGYGHGPTTADEDEFAKQVVALCDAYLAQREFMRLRTFDGERTELDVYEAEGIELVKARAALLAPETQNEGDG